MLLMASQASKILEQAVEQLTGDSAVVLRARSLEETRTIAEKRSGRPFQFVSSFPFIGRGNVMRDRVISHQEVEASLDRALRGR